MQSLPKDMNKWNFEDDLINGIEISNFGLNLPQQEYVS